jgi:hypothetical protein
LYVGAKVRALILFLGEKTSFLLSMLCVFS